MSRFLAKAAVSRIRSGLGQLVLCILLILNAFIALANLDSHSASVEGVPKSTFEPENPLDNARLKRQRTVFVEAEKAIRARQYDHADALQKQLLDYPLLPYLQYLRLSQDMAATKERDIKLFLNDYADSPLSERLRSQWLRFLAKRRMWHAYLKFSEESPALVASTAELNCYRRTALLSKKRYEDAYEDIKSLWLVGHSQDKACNPVFKAWQKNKGLKGAGIEQLGFKTNYYWDRALLALQARQFKLAAYLARQSKNAKYDARVERWVRVYRDPRKLIEKRYATDNSFDQKLVLMGLERLLKTRGKSFPQAWQLYAERVSGPSDDFRQFTHFVARWYSWHYDPIAWEWLERADPTMQDHTLLERRIRMALQARDWQGVVDWIGKLPLDQQGEPGWLYWEARACLNLLQAQVLRFYEPGRLHLTTASQAEGYFPWIVFNDSAGTSHDPLKFHLEYMRHLYADRTNHHDVLWRSLTPLQTYEVAMAQLATLSEQRNFYGFLASEFLGKAPSLNHRPIVLTSVERAAMIATPGVKAAFEWFQLNRSTEARRAWRHVVSGLSATEKSIAAKLAHELGWYDQAIHTAASGDNRDDLLVRFPMGHFELITQQAEAEGIAPDWVFALIRQESAYRAEARSPVGALGLMQLMPRTARMLHRKQGERYPGKRGVLQLENNVKLGTRYMGQLKERFGGNLPLATAGYNAGPHRSVSWQDASEAIPGDLWIETVPIAETRNYVKNIMTYQVIYRWHLGRTPQLDHSVASIPPLNQTDERYSMHP